MSLSSHRVMSLSGTCRPPGDKSISHRALIMGLLALGETRIEGLLEGDDVIHTAAACQALGAQIERQSAGLWSVRGAGLGSLLQPQDVLDFGNAGTGTRLMMGVVAGHRLKATFDGDKSLRKRPMRRILDPLVLMGADVLSQEQGGRCPVILQGTSEPIPIEYHTPVPSAQIKSAILLAGLNSLGQTCVVETEASRDHTEKLLSYFGADIVSVPFGESGRRITLQGRPNLVARPIIVPADPSSASFPLIAALIVPNSHILIEGVMINPLRTGLFTTLTEMGAAITISNQRIAGGEMIADLSVSSSQLKGVRVPAARAPSMIDEYPILAIAAAFAEGETRMEGLSELRVKESDRLTLLADGLVRNGIEAWVEGDDLIVKGKGSEVPGGGMIATHLDHRIAMSFLILGLATQHPVSIDDSTTIATSFPDFQSLMTNLGARFQTLPPDAGFAP